MTLQYIPLRDKRPLLSDWPNRTSPDPIEAYRLGEGAANGLGVATGATGIVVVDCDVDTGIFEEVIHPNGMHGLPRQRTGEEFFRAWCADRGIDPDDTFTVGTPSGGRHFYFLDAHGVFGCRTRVMPGVDLRGRGGQVAIAILGVSGYLTELPDSDELVTVARLPQAAETELAGLRSRVASGGARGRAARYTEDLEPTAVYLDRGVPAGVQHSVLLRLALREVGRGRGVEDVVAELLAVAAVSPQGDPHRPWTERDIRVLVESGKREVDAEAARIRAVMNSNNAPTRAPRLRPVVRRHPRWAN